MIIMWHRIGWCKALGYTDRWILDGINKSLGNRLNLQRQGFEWYQGYKRPGVWVTKSKAAAEKAAGLLWITITEAEG